MSIAPVNSKVLPKPGFLIDGELITDRADETFTHRYAATGEVTHEIPLAGGREVDAAVAAARKALPIWRGMPANERRRLMLKLAQAVRERDEELVQLCTAENGSPLSAVAGAPTWVAELFEYNAGFADKIGGEVVTTWPGPAFDYTLDEPYGVIAVIIPWNGPFIGQAQTMTPALAAGNTIVVKPPEQAPYTALRLAGLALEVGFPPGVINVIPGGPTGGAALTGHKGVDKIFFTGSIETAKRIQASAAQNVTPVGFELGGKSARLIFEDADLDQAAMWGMSAAVGLAGQACIAGSRILVHSSVHDDVLARMKTMLESTPIGDPQDLGTVMGPVIDDRAVDRIMGFIDRTRARGEGELVTGGERLGGDFADGYFIQPTVFAGVDPAAEVARDEVFGPVLAVMKFDTEEEALAIANDSIYGLAAYIHTNDLQRAHRVSAALESGTVWINGFVDLPVGAPFGGVKQSGNGRQGGKYAIQEFTRPKNVWMSL